MPKVMTSPHGQNQSHIPNSVNGKYFDRITRRKEIFAVKGHQQKGGQSQYFPSNKERFKISCQDGQVETQIKEKDRIEKPLVSRLSVQVIPTVKGDQEGEHCPNNEVYCTNSVKEKIYQKLKMLVFEKNNLFEIEILPSLQNPEPKENQGTQEVNPCGVKCNP